MIIDGAIWDGFTFPVIHNGRMDMHDNDFKTIGMSGFLIFMTGS
jgi:hypothetical protein